MFYENRCLRRFVIHSLATFCCVLLVSDALAASFRTWTDASGKFQIRAKFDSFQKDKVRLKREDGKTLDVSISKLSRIDKGYVGGLLDSSPFMTDEEKALILAIISAPEKSSGSPARSTETPSGETPSGETPADETPAGDSSPAPTTRTIDPVDWSTVRKLSAPLPTMEWGLEMSSRKPPEEGSKSKVKIVVSPPEFMQERLSDAVANPSGSCTLLGYIGGRPGLNQQYWTRYVRCMMDRGSQGIATKPVAGHCFPVDVHDDGKLFLVKGIAKDETEPTVMGLWRIEGKTIEEDIEWTPYQGASENKDDADLSKLAGSKNIRWASMLSETRVATMNDRGMLVVWDLAAGKPLYYLEIQSGSMPGLSPDRRYIAFCTDKGLGILDLKAEEIVVQQDFPEIHFAWPQFKFSPSGKRLSCWIFGPRILVWDCTNGKLLHDITSFSDTWISELNWVGDDYLLFSHMGKHRLFEVDSELPIWVYEGPEKALMVNGKPFWLMLPKDRRSKGVLFNAQIPHPEAKNIAAKIKNDPETFLISPGKGVSLQLSVPGEKRDEVEATLVRKLQERELKVDPSSLISLRVSSKTNPPQKVTIHLFGQPGSGEYQAPSCTCMVELVYQGKTIWEQSCSSMMGGMFFLGEGETVQQKLDEGAKPPWNFVKNIQLPGRILNPNISSAMGRSTVPMPRTR